jgi:hypothetical protein
MKDDFEIFDVSANGNGADATMAEQARNDIYAGFLANENGYLVATMMDIDDSYKALAQARIVLSDATDKVNDCADALSVAEAEMILGGHVTGSNETQRKAKLDDMTRGLSSNLRNAQKSQRVAQLKYDLARDGVEQWRLFVQIKANN